ncbi:hypothetical protein ACWFR5_13655 [Streptomyces sp. NPDC055092]
MKKIAFAGASAFVGLTIFYGITLLLDLGSSQTRARTDDANSDVLDAEKRPFDWKMNPGLPASEPWVAWDLDRTLTDAEQQRVNTLGSDTTALWSFVKERGGRRVGMAAGAYKLQLTSEKQKAVLITELSARTTKCWKPTVRTSISIGEGGTETWDDVHFNLSTRGTPAPPLAFKQDDPTESPSEVPYNKAISLGGTQSPGLLIITPFLTAQKDCNWEINVTYNVNSGKSEQSTIKTDGSGHPLKAYGLKGEGVDSWTWTQSGWVQST